MVSTVRKSHVSILISIVLLCSILITSASLNSAVAQGSFVPFKGFVKPSSLQILASTKKDAKSIATLRQYTIVTVLDTVKIGKQSWSKIEFSRSNKKQQGYVLSSSISRYAGAKIYDVSMTAEEFLAQMLDMNPGTSEEVPANGYAVVVFRDIGTYSGNFKNSQRSGQGTFIWKNGDRYDGEWANDKISGKGKLTFKNGNVYQGTFKNGKITAGTITIKLSKNRVYKRSVSNGRLNVNGTLIWPDKTTLKGKISGNKFVGNVTISYPNGDKYVGGLKNNKKSGTGTYTWKNGAKYKGQWLNDKMHGTGVYYFSRYTDRNYLKGTFKNNQPYGTAVYVWKKGLSYDTTWKNGVCKSIKYKK